MSTFLIVVGAVTLLVSVVMSAALRLVRQTHEHEQRRWVVEERRRWRDGSAGASPPSAASGCGSRVALLTAVVGLMTASVGFGDKLLSREDDGEQVSPSSTIAEANDLVTTGRSNSANAVDSDGESIPTAPGPATAEDCGSRRVGDNVAFKRADTIEGESGLYTASALDGSSIAPLVVDRVSVAEPDWSPDGRRLVYVRDPDGVGAETPLSGIFVISPGGGAPQRLTQDEGNNYGPVWSPDCERIAFVSTRLNGSFDVYVMNSDGSGLAPVTNHSAKDLSPSWSPDGASIAFQSDRDGNFEIYVTSLGDPAVVRRLTEHASLDRAPAWSPTGDEIAFESRRDGDSEIYVMKLDGTSLRNLSRTPASEDVAPAWSPDGAMLAFESDRDGGRDIYRMRASDGADVRNLTRSSEFEGDVAW